MIDIQARRKRLETLKSQVEPHMIHWPLEMSTTIQDEQQIVDELGLLREFVARVKQMDDEGYVELKSSDGGKTIIAMPEIGNRWRTKRNALVADLQEKLKGLT